MENTENPHLKILNINYIEYLKKIVKDEFKGKKINILDIGGGARADGYDIFNEENIEYTVIDLAPGNLNAKRENILYIKGDITDKNLDINCEYDIIFTKDTFEHILNPWDATSNIIKYLKNNGILIFMAPFSWRYHSYPYDTYRYTHIGAQYLFERFGKLKKIDSGYYYANYECSGKLKSKKI